MGVDTVLKVLCLPISRTGIPLICQNSLFLYLAAHLCLQFNLTPSHLLYLESGTLWYPTDDPGSRCFDEFHRVISSSKMIQSIAQEGGTGGGGGGPPPKKNMRLHQLGLLHLEVQGEWGQS